MRVLYLSPGHPAHDARFAAAIRETGHEPVVVIVDRALAPDEARSHVLAAIEAANPDVIHAGPLQAVTLPVVRAGGHPLLAVSWAYDLMAGGQSDTELAAARAALAGCDALLVDCEAARRAAVALGVDEARIVTLPWGVDLEEFVPGRDAAATSLRAANGMEDAVVVLTSRSLEPVYGMDVALAGFLDAARARPRLALLIAGDGSLRDALERQASASDAASRIRFLGALPPPAMRTAFRAADAWLSMSHVDGTSVGMLEAMAAGLPVVAADTGGTGEWVEPGRSGWLVRDGDAGGVARALVELADGDAALRVRLGARGRRIVEARADWHGNIGRLGAAYELARRVAAGRPT